MSDGARWTARPPVIMAAGRSAARDRMQHAGSTTITEAIPDDIATVQAVLAGDRDAFRRLVEREAASVVRACYRVLGDSHEAEDVAQEAFVTAYRSLSTWRGDGPFGAWLSRIAVRLAIRQAGRRRQVAWLDPVASSDAPRDAAGAALTAAAVDAAPTTDPLALSLRSERDTSLRRAVARLDEPYRETVSLRFFGELSLEEIARQTGRPLGTVKTHLHRGLQRLRASIEQGGVA